MQTYTVRTSFTVPKGYKAVLKERATSEGISMSELIRRATSEDKLHALSVPKVG